MVFLPAIGVDGLAGWRVLQKTAPKQQEVFERSPVLTRNIEYFRENIASATTAEDLVNDRRLLTVALGAFGLADEVDKKGFVLKILEEGTEDSQAFAVRLNDPRFEALAQAFGYGNLDGGANIQRDAFREDIIARYKTMEFERAVGEVDNDMRLAMNFKREIAEIAASDEENDTRWFQILGNRPLRELVSTALFIPTEVAQLDLDQQLDIFSSRAEKVFGDASPSVFSDPEVIDDTIRRFFLNRQIENGPSAATPGFTALTLLQTASLGAVSTTNLFLSQS